ncbi:AlpA family phage regulatory protein [Entomomonas moraniae]|uniref:AlpA family phage regulatory protein n=1 Tax=Entomomonas moraniae TaxID=2213226 RepID=A0A3Q9JJ40_9GAMM|nr:AlpA family phage regulatory protein [Entomomonas moraniae]AZS50692.1 AlpA family phage regulatory protein [Entomomonas moraniae]
MSDRFLTKEQVSEKVGLAVSTIYKYMKLGEFPKQHKIIGGKSARWSENQINEWIEEQIKNNAA